jgi:hypothetical protein
LTGGRSATIQGNDLEDDDTRFALLTPGLTAARFRAFLRVWPAGLL